MSNRILKYSLGVGGACCCAYLFANNGWNGVDHINRYLGFKSQSNTSRTPRVVVLGSGWGAMSFIQKLDELQVELVVISPRSFFFYTPLLAGSTTGTVSYNSIMEPIRWHTARFGSGSFIMAECKSVDFAEGVVQCVSEDGRAFNVNYDHLVIAVGAEPATFGIPGDISSWKLYC